MCGRYYIEIDEEELREIVSEAEKKTQATSEQLTLKTGGDIFPTDTVPVQTGIGLYQPMRWGFVAYNGKPVINARSETVMEKPMFKESMLERRCLIPASGYYEWQKDGGRKIKYRLFIPGSSMYFAGCWRQEKGRGFYTFVILTQPAADGLAFIHDRMPVIIPRSLSGDWLQGGPDAMREAVTELAYRQE